MDHSRLVGHHWLVGSGGSCGAGLFSNSLKCSIHLFWSSSSGYTGFSLLSFTGLSRFLNFPHSFLRWCTVPVDFLGEPSLLFVASMFMYSLLSAFMLFLAVLLAVEYSSQALTFSVIRLLSISAFFSFFFFSP